MKPLQPKLSFLMQFSLLDASTDPSFAIYIRWSAIFHTDLELSIWANIIT